MTPAEDRNHAGPWEKSVPVDSWDPNAIYRAHKITVRLEIDGREVLVRPVNLDRPYETKLMNMDILRAIRVELLPIPEFPGMDWPEPVKALIQNETVGTWVDHSYHNDAMPQLVNVDLQVALWVNVPADAREDGLEWDYSLQRIDMQHDGKSWEYGDDLLTNLSHNGGKWELVAEILDKLRKDHANGRGREPRTAH